MDIQVLDANPLYAGETYRLKFTFSQNYPIEVRFPPAEPLHMPPAPNSITSCMHDDFLR